MFLGLRTIIYPAPELERAKAWWTEILGTPPYFDEPFYVGFNIAGHELGLTPDGDPASGPTTYWGVANADAACARLVSAGAEPREAVHDVGDGIRVGSVLGPDGSIIGIIENPHFAPVDVSSAGPGR